MEKKASALALSMWFPATRFIKQTKPPSLLPIQSEDQLLHSCNHLAVTAQTGKMTPKQITQQPQNVAATRLTAWGKQQSQNVSTYNTNKCEETTTHPSQWIHQKTYTDHAGEEITVSQPVGEREQQCRTHNQPVRSGYDHIIHKFVGEKLRG